MGAKMKTDYDAFPCPSRRHVTFGRRGMVCASSNLAAQAGLDILKAGGNAVDAAVAAAVCLTVTEPVSNGIGGDAFALVWMKGSIHGLNASGSAPARISAEAVREAGYEVMPEDGWIPVTVPGAPSAWKALSERFGALAFERLFEPAVRYAQEGYVVPAVIAKEWKRAYDAYHGKHAQDPLYAEWFRVFAPGGHAPEAGEIWSSPLHAQTLRELADTGCDSFYRGRLCRVIDDYARQTGGYLRKEDLERYAPQWVDPLCMEYRGYDVWELPPNGHGMVVLMALNILKHFDLEQMSEEERIHVEMEAMKLAFADGKHYIADPACMQAAAQELLTEEYGIRRAGLIGGEALFPEPGDPCCKGTVYLCTADGDGNMVSYIQSNYCGFGSGIVVPGTGIALHDRGANFSLDPSSVNVLMPGKRPYHTIIPGFLSKDGKAVGPFGVMGAFMQPQGHVQVLVNMLDKHMNPQAALDAPRWQWTGEKKIEMESFWTEEIIEAMKRRGHEVTVTEEPAGFGRGQIILRGENGSLAGGTEPRADGSAAAY